jgi:hypothetical protein
VCVCLAARGWSSEKNARARAPSRLLPPRLTLLNGSFSARSETRHTKKLFNKKGKIKKAPATPSFGRAAGAPHSTTRAGRTMKRAPRRGGLAWPTPGGPTTVASWRLCMMQNGTQCKKIVQQSFWPRHCLPAPHAIFLLEPLRQPNEAILLWGRRLFHPFVA